MRLKIETGNDSDGGADGCMVDTAAGSDSNSSRFMLIAENHSAALCNGSAVTEVPVLHERNDNEVDDVVTPLPAAHHITTRSVTGRLAKRPRKDLSPARSPPRKIGILCLFVAGYQYCDVCNCCLYQCIMTVISKL